MIILKVMVVYKEKGQLWMLRIKQPLNLQLAQNKTNVY